MVDKGKYAYLVVSRVVISGVTEEEKHIVVAESLGEAYDLFIGKRGRHYIVESVEKVCPMSNILLS